MTQAALDVAATWDGIYRSGRQRYFPSEAVIRFAARRLAPATDARDWASTVRILEMGCGNGANLWGLGLLGYTLVGVDASRVALEEAARVLTARCHGCCTWDLHEGDVRTWDDGSRFDAVIDHQVSQHLPWSEHEPTYAHYRRLLKPGGWLCLVHLNDRTRPDAQQQHGRTGAQEYATWGNIEPPAVYPGNGQVCMPALEALVKCVERAGFEAARFELLGRIVIDPHSDSEPTCAAHTAIDAQRLRS